VHAIPRARVRARLHVQNAERFASSRTHLIYADEVMAMRKFIPRSTSCATCSASSRPHRRARLLGSGRSLARICHEVARRADGPSPAISSRRPTATPAWAA
jgi:hypothetical protein